MIEMKKNKEEEKEIKAMDANKKELNKEELNNEELNNEELEKVNGSGLVTGFNKNYLHPDINQRKNKTENE